MYGRGQRLNIMKCIAATTKHIAFGTVSEIIFLDVLAWCWIDRNDRKCIWAVPCIRGIRSQKQYGTLTEKTKSYKVPEFRELPIYI